MAQAITPISSSKYRGRFAVAAPEIGFSYLSEASLRMVGPHDRHAHAQIQVLWVVDGEMGMEIGRSWLRVPAGGGLILLPGRTHRVNRPADGMPETTATVVDLRLTDDPGLPMTAFVRRLPQHAVIAGDPAAVSAAAHRLRSAVAATGLARSAKLLSAVWGLLGELAAGNGNGAGDPPAGEDRRLARAERYMADHLSAPVGVDHVAEAVGLSRSQLTRLLVRHRGAGPAELLRRMRVARARQLLRTSALGIKEVARACGFASPHHFSRVYHDATGTRPTADRRADRE